MSKKYTKTNTYKSLTAQQKGYIDHIEKLNYITFDEAEKIQGFNGIYLVMTLKPVDTGHRALVKNTLLYSGKSFPKNLKSATRLAQHATGDLTISSAVRYLSDNNIIKSLPLGIYKHHKSCENYVAINNASRRDQVISGFGVILLECPERLDDGTQTEDFIHNYYKNIQLEESDSVTNFSKVFLINKPGKSKYKGKERYKLQEDLRIFLEEEYGHKLKSHSEAHCTLRTIPPGASKNDYFNFTSKHFNTTKFAFYLHKSSYSKNALEKIKQVLLEKNVPFNDNTVHLSIPFKFSLENMTKDLLYANNTIKYLFNSL